MSGPSRRRGLPDPVQLASEVVAGERVALARAITLIESENPAHHRAGETLLDMLMPHCGGALRLGITGSPGVGKSTFIEALGMRLADDGHKLAVLAVDPSSTVSGGSILGDKTRMADLSRHPNAFIRPSPSGGSLGGVSRKTRESLMICESSGFDIVLVETVGVGQSETAVRGMVDLFLLLVQPGAGDELQGIKKGVVELADLLVVTKADGDLLQRARRSESDYRMALHYLARPEGAFAVEVLAVSSTTGQGVGEVWQTVRRFERHEKASGAWQRRRRQQAEEWMDQLVVEALEARFHSHPRVADELDGMRRSVRNGEVSPRAAARRLIDLLDV